MVDVRALAAPEFIGQVEGRQVRINRQFFIFLDQLRRRTGGDSDPIADSDFVVGTATADLGSERVGTTTATISWDIGTAAQVKLDVVALSIGTAQLTDAGVTYAKIQDVSATDKLLGRSTAGAGDVEEIACTSAGRALLDDADAAAQRATLGLADAFDNPHQFMLMGA